MRSSLETKLWVLESSEWLYQQRNWKNVTSMSNTARTKLALQCGWQDGRLFLNLESQERGSHSNVEPYACEEEEERSKKSNNEKFPAEESQPNALQWSSTSQQSNVEQLSISCPDQRSRRKCNCQSFLQCIHWRCLYWQNHPLCASERGSNVHNNPSGNFSISRAEHSH